MAESQFPQLQVYDPRTGAFNSADIYVCRIVVPWPHYVLGAWLWSKKIVTTGTVSVYLRYADVHGAAGGVPIGTPLENVDLGDHTDVCERFILVLGEYSTLLAPARRLYFFGMSASDAADRVDEPLLELSLRRA